MEAAPPPGFVVKRGVRGKGPGSDIDRASSLNPGTPTALAGGGGSGSLLSASSLGCAGGGGDLDTPFGYSAAVPPLSGSLAAFKRRCEWFYIDPSGEEHGPVPLAKIANWYKKGHFPEDVKVSQVWLCAGRGKGRLHHSGTTRPPPINAAVIDLLMQVRCRSPWYGVAALIKSLDEAPDAETPTAAAAAGGGPHRLSSASSGFVGGPDGVPPPPPPPPRPAGAGSSSGGPAIGSYEGDLHLLFVGDPTWGPEPVRHTAAD
jgi:hypothetical protein